VRAFRELTILALSLALYNLGPWLSYNLEPVYYLQVALRFMTLAAGMRATGAMLNLWAMAQGVDVDGRAHLKDLWLLYLVYVASMALASAGALSLLF
jgi:hypothetical protein